MRKQLYTGLALFLLALAYTVAGMLENPADYRSRVEVKGMRVMATMQVDDHAYEVTVLDVGDHAWNIMHDRVPRATSGRVLVQWVDGEPFRIIEEDK